MSLILRDGFFVVIGLIALWSLTKDLATGNAAARWKTTTSVDENPAGFYLIVCVKAAFVCFGIAVALHALGLIRDPYVWIAQHTPFLMHAHRTT